MSTEVGTTNWQSYARCWQSIRGTGLSVTSAWDALKGHQEQRALFERSVQRGRLSHAYVLAGSDGIGKRKFARLLAQSMFCRERKPDEIDACGECRACRSFIAGTWPDYIEIGLPAGKSVIPIELIAGDSDKRGREGLCFELSMSPQASDRRVAIINDAHRMNAEGANSLLKTLEEPPSQALILLVCDNPDSLLPTIRSRCQVVRFFPLTETDVKDILIAEEMVESPEEAATIAAMAEGSITLAAQLLNPDLRQLRQLISQQLDQLENMKPVEVSKQVTDELERISSGADEQRRNGQWLLRFVAEVLNGRLRRLTSGDFSDPLLKRFGVRNGVDMLAPLLDRVISAAHQIEGNSPVRLVLEAMFDDIARQLRLGPISAR